MFAWISALVMAFMFQGQSSGAAVGSGNPASPGGNSGQGPQNVHDVPEIDLFSGGAVLMILATLGLLMWERHRRSVAD